jgi:hypothetical protein
VAAADREVSMARPSALHSQLLGKLQLGSEAGAIHSLVLGNWLSSLFSKLESWLSDQKHMIQFGAIGMVIALFIIWWRKT